MRDEVHAENNHGELSLVYTNIGHDTCGMWVEKTIDLLKNLELLKTWSLYEWEASSKMLSLVIVMQKLSTMQKEALKFDTSYFWLAATHFSTNIVNFATFVNWGELKWYFNGERYAKSFSSQCWFCIFFSFSFFSTIIGQNWIFY